MGVRACSLEEPDTGICRPMWTADEQLDLRSAAMAQQIRTKLGIWSLVLGLAQAYQITGPT